MRLHHFILILGAFLLTCGVLLARHGQARHERATEAAQAVPAVSVTGLPSPGDGLIRDPELLNRRRQARIHLLRAASGRRMVRMGWVIGVVGIALGLWSLFLRRLARDVADYDAFEPVPPTPPKPEYEAPQDRRAA